MNLTIRETKFPRKLTKSAVRKIKFPRKLTQFATRKIKFREKNGFSQPQN